MLQEGAMLVQTLIFLLFLTISTDGEERKTPVKVNNSSSITTVFDQDKRLWNTTEKDREHLLQEAKGVGKGLDSKTKNKAASNELLGENQDDSNRDYFFFHKLIAPSPVPNPVPVPIPVVVPVPGPQPAPAPAPTPAPATPNLETYGTFCTNHMHCERGLYCKGKNCMPPDYEIAGSPIAKMNHAKSPKPNQKAKKCKRPKNKNWPDVNCFAKEFCFAKKRGAYGVCLETPCPAKKCQVCFDCGTDGKCHKKTKKLFRICIVAYLKSLQNARKKKKDASNQLLNCPLRRRFLSGGNDRGWYFCNENKRLDFQTMGWSVFWRCSVDRTRNIDFCICTAHRDICTQRWVTDTDFVGFVPEGADRNTIAANENIGLDYSSDDELHAEFNSSILSKKSSFSNNSKPDKIDGKSHAVSANSTRLKVETTKPASAEQEAGKLRPKRQVRPGPTDTSVSVEINPGNNPGPSRPQPDLTRPTNPSTGPSVRPGPDLTRPSRPTNPSTGPSVRPGPDLTRPSRPTNPSTGPSVRPGPDLTRPSRPTNPSTGPSVRPGPDLTRPSRPTNPSTGPSVRPGPDLTRPSRPTNPSLGPNVRPGPEPFNPSQGPRPVNPSLGPNIRPGPEPWNQPRPPNLRPGPVVRPGSNDPWTRPDSDRPLPNRNTWFFPTLSSMEGILRLPRLTNKMKIQFNAMSCRNRKQVGNITGWFFCPTEVATQLPSLKRRCFLHKTADPLRDDPAAVSPFPFQLSSAEMNQHGENIVCLCHC